MPVEARILVSHLGYNTGTQRHAIIAVPRPETSIRCRLLPLDGSAPAPLPVTDAAGVDGWSTGSYARVDLSGLGAGAYRLEAEWSGGRLTSEEFTVGEETLHAQTLSDALYYFASVRSSGEIDRKDRTAALWGDTSGLTIDARGGWLDASGDTSKFLSHLTYTPMMSPQQVPLCVWAFLDARDQLAARHPRFARIVGARLRDEALWGADFLTRFRHPDGYFLVGIFDALTKNLDERIINAPLPESVRTDRYQASFRGGGGLAIAALARASRESEHGDFGNGDYLDAAARGFADLQENNLRYLQDGVESVVDDYCALLAATELAGATGSATGSVGAGTDTDVDTEMDVDYGAAAEARVESLIARYRAGQPGDPGHLVGAADGRPYFHAVESGLPIVALLRFADVLGSSRLVAAARELALSLARDTVERTDATDNPFGYPRQLVQPLGEPTREAFFFPHENETGYWWQGENANIASVAVAALACSRLAECPPELAARLERLASDQIHWIVGVNPYDVCMMQGRGRNNIEYMVEFPNVPGGIVNGITSGVDDEHDIGFLTGRGEDSDDSWRWAEQWIPHTAWFIAAMSRLD